jgi:hypothetical protein
MIADQVKERLPPGEVPGTPECMAVPPGLALIHKGQVHGMIACNGSEGDFIVGVDNEARIIYSRSPDLFDDDAEDGFLLTITIDKCLKRQTALPFPRCRDDCFSDLHNVFL